MLVVSRARHLHCGLEHPSPHGEVRLSIENELGSVKEWAQDKAQRGSEPPWAWYQYMKLIEAINAIQSGMASTTTENSPRAVEHSGKLIQLKAAKCLPNNARHDPDAQEVPLPM